MPSKCDTRKLRTGKRGGKYYLTKNKNKIYCKSGSSSKKSKKKPSKCDSRKLKTGKKGGKYYVSKGKKRYCKNKKSSSKKSTSKKSKKSKKSTSKKKKRSNKPQNSKMGARVYKMLYGMDLTSSFFDYPNGFNKPARTIPARNNNSRWGRLKFPEKIIGGWLGIKKDYPNGVLWVHAYSGLNGYASAIQDGAISRAVHMHLWKEIESMQREVGGKLINNNKGTDFIKFQFV